MAEQININITDSVPLVNQATIDLNGNTGNTYSKTQLDSWVTSGIKGVATVTTVPSATGFERWLAHTAGTYTNFSGIVVSEADLDIINGVANNRVILEVNNGVATKIVERVKGDSRINKWVAQAYTAGQQVIHEGSIYEANTATGIDDVPNVSLKWAKVFSTDDPSGNYNMPNEIAMVNIPDNRYYFDAKSYLQWARVNKFGKLNEITFNVKFKAGLNVIIKKFKNNNDLQDPTNNGVLVLEKELTNADYISSDLTIGTLKVDTNVNDGDLIGAFFYFENTVDIVSFEHFYFNGSPYPNANIFYWTGNDNKLLVPSIISESYSYYGVPLQINYVSDSDKKIAILEDKFKARIVLPKKLWAIVGKEFNIYFDAIALLPDTGSESPNYIFSILCPLGGTTNNRFTLTPDAWMIGQHVFFVQVFDNFGNKVEEKECQLNIVDAKNTSTVKNILMIGDSTTDDTAEVVRNLKNNFNSFSSGISPRMVGHKPYFGEEHLNHGASSGKTFDFFANGMTVLKFNVNGLPTSNIGVYPNLTMSLMDGTGYLVAILSHLNGDGTGYVIANIWNTGSQTIGEGFVGNLATNGAAGFPTQLNVTSTEELQNWSPLRLNGSLSFQDYENYIGYPIDLLSIDLGINDSRGLVQPRDVRDSILANILKIVDAYKIYKPSGKVMLCLPKSCSNPRSKSSLHHDTYRINIHNLREDIINNFDANSNYPNVFVCYSGLAMDRKYGYPSSMEKVASRYSQTVRVIADDLHPINEGYAQIADAMVATIIGNV